jgi:hypothetical protein
MRKLFIEVNKIGKVEKRRDLSKLDGLEAAGFTEEDIKRANTCGGIVFCPASGSDGPSYVTAFSLVSPDQVFFPAHLFFRKDANHRATTLRSNLDNCYFRNYTHPKDHIPLKMGEAQKKYLHEVNPGSKYIRDQLKDGLKIEIARPIPDCQPFDVDRSGEPMGVGDKVIAIGAPTPDIVPRPSGFEPVGQFCQIMEPILFSERPSYYYSDCSNSPGQSGAIEFKRIVVTTKEGAVQYKWVAKAMETGGGDSKWDGHDFNLAIGSATKSIGIEADHLRSILNKPNIPKQPAAGGSQKI